MTLALLVKVASFGLRSRSCEKKSVKKHVARRKISKGITIHYYMPRIFAAEMLYLAFKSPLSPSNALPNARYAFNQSSLDHCQHCHQEVRSFRSSR